MKAQLFIRKQILYVRFDGELDSSVTSGLRVKISELITNYKIKFLIFNCDNLTFMDSSGIGFIIGRYNQLRDVEGMIYMTNLNELLKKIVKLSGLYKLVRIVDSEEDVNRELEGYNGQVHESAI